MIILHCLDLVRLVMAERKPYRSDCVGAVIAMERPDMVYIDIYM